MQTLKKSFIIVSMAALLALGTAALLPSPALAACTPTPTTLDDFIVCDGSVTAIDGLTGNDTITNYGTVNYLYGGEGRDSITNYGTVSYIIGDEGRDSINNYGLAFLIFGASENDIITNYGTAIGILGNEGHDIINNYGIAVGLSGNEGHDTINNYGAALAIFGDDGNDIINNYGGALGIIGDAGNDIINNYGFVVELIDTGTGDDNVIMGREFVMLGLVDGGADFDILTFDTVGDTRAEVRALLLALAENKSAGTLKWRGETFSWVNFEALTGSARYRKLVLSDGLIRVTETIDSLLIIGLDKGKINLAVPVNFTRLKHVTDGQTIANFTDKDGYNLQLSVLSAEDNLWTVYYYAPDGTLISSYNFEFDPIW